MSIEAYVEVKYDGSDEWAYCGEFIRLRDGEFAISPRIYPVDEINAFSFTNVMRAYFAFNDNLSAEVKAEIGDLEHVIAVNFDSLATTRKILNEFPVDYDEFPYVKEIKDIVDDLEDLIVFTCMWKFEDEYRVILVDNENF